MLEWVRRTLTEQLWLSFLDDCPKEALFLRHLQNKLNQPTLPLDHFAIIDLPSTHSGIPILQGLFTLLGYILQGRGYLPEKHNEFAWFTCMNAFSAHSHSALPQVVLADFKLHLLPSDVQHIVKHYTQHIEPPPIETWITLSQHCIHGDKRAQYEFVENAFQYLRSPQWPTPSHDDVYRVFQHNELLAWVLAHGKQVNHFTVSIHLLNAFSDLNDFHRELSLFPDFKLNSKHSIIKGNAELGIEQSSTEGLRESTHSLLLDTQGFLEFIWRHPKKPHHSAPLWPDRHQHFIAEQANFVIESIANMP